MIQSCGIFFEFSWVGSEGQLKMRVEAVGELVFSKGKSLEISVKSLDLGFMIGFLIKRVGVLKEFYVGKRIKLFRSF